MTALPTAALGFVKIGKTTYRITAIAATEGRAGTHWTLSYGKQVKNLFYSESLDCYTLWSCRGGLRGLGMPKLVKVEFSR